MGKPFDATVEGLILNTWCGKGDSNPHGFHHKILNLARLPFRHSRGKIAA